MPLVLVRDQKNWSNVDFLGIPSLDQEAFRKCRFVQILDTWLIFRLSLIIALADVFVTNIYFLVE